MGKKITDYTLLILLDFLVSVWAMTLLSGCGGYNENIPSASVLTSGRVTLSWNQVPGAISYNVYLSTSPGVTKLNGYKIRNATSPITITDLEPGTTYYFIVTVIDESGESEESKEMSYTVSDTEGFVEFDGLSRKAVPDRKSSESEKKPVIVESEKAPVTAGPEKRPLAVSEEKRSAEGMPESEHRKVGTKRSEAMAPHKASHTPVDQGPGTKQITLTWDKVANATSYNVYWGKSPGVTRRSKNKISSVENSVTIKDLETGTYYFVVTAVNESGESKESKEFSYTVVE